VVGVQPFGGEGKSGTGPKAGGPLYVKRLQRAAPALLDHQRKALPSLDALLVWAGNHGHTQLVALGEGYMRTTPTGMRLELPGPTGERNTLAFAPRGAVLCAATSIDALLNQLAAALATGNKALLPTSSLSLLPADLPPGVRDQIQPVADDMAKCQFQLAMVDRGAAALLQTNLAARPGAIVGMLDTDAASAIPLWRLVAERALCVNTTAAGGNASLMTLGL
jgi:RHH-type proline utilization regulon transcriptional repressor/proline dehydrogenase/delta 1-pyrroline-5-carboxylate dehydrogenase